MYKVAIPGKSVVQSIDPKLLTEEYKKTRTLEVVNLIKEKIYGCIKGRTCSYLSRKYRYIRDDKTVSPLTVSLEALFLTLLVVAHEGRDVVTFNATGAFIHVELPKDKKCS